MKLNFRKIASVLTSTVMLGSTLALAAAANYPAPFVQSGSADVAIVYGSNAAVTDLVAVGDINTDLQAKLAAQTAVTGSGSSSVSVTGGDSVELDRPSSKQHLGSGISDVFGRSVTSSDMPTLLADGVFTSNGDNKDQDYTQKIDVENLSITQFDDSAYIADTPTLGVKLNSGDPILNYTLTFSTNPAFNDNLKNSDINLMGKNYLVLSENNASGSQSVTFLDSASTQSFNEGETKSVTVGNSTYDITVTDVTSDNKVKLSIAGKTSSSLDIGATYKITDGVYIGVKDVIYKSKDAAVSHAELSVGAGKLILQDGSDVQLNDNSVNGLVAHVINDSTGTKLNKIVLQWKSDGRQFITPNNSLVMPGFGALKLSFPGMSFPTQEMTDVVSDGKYTVQLNAPIKDGAAQLSILSNNATDNNFTVTGKDFTRQLITSGANNITYDADTAENFIASWANGKDSESYVLYADNFNQDTSNNNVTTIKNRITGKDVGTYKNGDTVVLGNVQLGVGAIDKNGRSVVLTNSDSNTNFHTLYTVQGLKVYLPYVNSTLTSSGAGVFNATGATKTSSLNLVFSEEDKDGNIGVGNNVTLTLGITSKGYVTVSNAAFSGSGSNFDELQSSNVFQGTSYSALATQVAWDQGPDQQTATLTYHGGESYGPLLLTDVSASVSGGSSGSGSGSVKTLGSISVSDSEVSSVSGKNLVVVGGSCVNLVAAKLLGSNSALCGDAWQQATNVGSGSFLVQTFASPYAAGKIATLVAGYNAPDTTNAAMALTTQSVDTTVGKKYTGTVSNAITLATTNSTA